MKPVSCLVGLSVGLAVLAAVRPAAAAPAFGFRGGMTIARQTGNDAIVRKSRTAFDGGGFVSFPLAPGWAIQPELLYVMKGGKLESQGTDEAGNPTAIQTATYALDYLELPVLLRIGLPELAGVRPALLVGPAVAVEVREQFKDSGESHDVDIAKDTDAGVVLGLGLEGGRGRTRWLLDARYELGILDLEHPTFGDGGVRNSTFSISAGIGWSPVQ